MHRVTIVVTLVVLFFSLVKPSFAAFTIEDEKKLGKKFYDQLQEKNILLQEATVNEYVRTIGKRLLASGEKSPFHFTFSVIKNSGINAFATPGGYIYVYEGLIELTENESELAGVLAHEIAHVKSRHIAKTIDKSQKISLASLVAILAGAFLGGGGEGAAAITSFSMATASALNLKYSRENEEEADRKGMRYLVSCGYDGRAMLDFLRIMRRYEYYSNSIPSYFLTHPGTGERIRYLDGLLQVKYTDRGKTSIVGGLNRVKTILVLGEKTPHEGLTFFKNALKEDPENVDFLYGLAVVQAQIGKTNEALINFNQALKQLPGDEDILRDLGICYYKMGRAEDAIAALKKVLSVNKDNPETILYLGQSYDAIGDYLSALELYEQFKRDHPGNIKVYYNLAMTYGKINNHGESHFNFGMYFKKKNKPQSALFHFRAALKYFPLETPKGRIIQQEINTIVPDSHHTGKRN